jgi:4-amino-4-deoxy-L-arabinose transferase-like glycosyltransferase
MPISSSTRAAPREPALWFALLFAMAWVLLPALINPGQPGDHFEQFTWAHSMEGGYHKHPPLPTWLLALAMQVLGPTPYATYAVAAMLQAGTGIFTFLFARRLIGHRLAALAIVLWGLHWSFTWKAQMLNHNTAMMVCMAAVAWLTLEAAHRERAWGWWAAAGVAAGLGLLSKYQSAVPLAGVILALAGAGLLARRANLLGLLLAVAVALAVFSPHVAWMVQNDFVTLRYASATVHQLEGAQRLLKLLSFSGLQLRMLGMATLCIGALLLWQRPLAEARPVEDTPATPDRERRAWMLGLIVWPLLVLAVLCTAQGMRLQDHWGFQAMQFVCLWLAWQLRRESAGSLPRLMLLAVVAHLLVMAAYSRSVWDPRTLAKRGRPDQFYPAQALADDVMKDWQRASTCPLRYVVGETYDAGMVSVYSGVDPAVLEGNDPARSPWIDVVDLRAAGSVHVYDKAPAELPPGALPLLYHRSFHVPGTEASLHDVYWALVVPAPCATATLKHDTPTPIP